MRTSGVGTVGARGVGVARLHVRATQRRQEAAQTRLVLSTSLPGEPDRGAKCRAPDMPFRRRQDLGASLSHYRARKPLLRRRSGGEVGWKALNERPTLCGRMRNK